MRQLCDALCITRLTRAALLATSIALDTANAQSTSVDSADATLRRAVADYVGLYRRNSLDVWEKLFLPSFTAANTRVGGGTSMRTREEFFASQRRYLAGAEVTEELENVRIERNGRLASVWADFIVTENGQRRRGKLVLLALLHAGEWKFHSLLFAYDP